MSGRSPLPHPGDGPGPPGRARVLVVDDSATVRLALQRILVALGVPEDHTYLAENERQALQLFDEYGPSVVFLDIDLGLNAPDASGVMMTLTPAETVSGGVRLCEEMLSSNPNLKVIVCSGLEPADPQFRKLIQMGAFAVLPKPIRAAAVRAILQDIESEESSVRAFGAPSPARPPSDPADRVR